MYFAKQHCLQHLPCEKGSTVVFTHLFSQLVGLGKFLENFNEAETIVWAKWNSGLSYYGAA